MKTAGFVVYPIKMNDRKNYQLRVYRDGKFIESKSARSPRKRDAERAAKDLEEYLNSQQHNVGRTPWETFRNRYSKEVLATKSGGHQEGFGTVCNHIEDLLKVEFLDELDASALSQFQALLLENGATPSSLQTYLARLSPALEWAVKVNLAKDKPYIAMPKPPQKAGGRPLTTEEYERMLNAIDKVVGKFLKCRP